MITLLLQVDVLHKKSVVVCLFSLCCVIQFLYCIKVQAWKYIYSLGKEDKKKMYLTFKVSILEMSTSTKSERLLGDFHFFLLLPSKRVFGFVLFCHVFENGEIYIRGSPRREKEATGHIKQRMLNENLVYRALRDVQESSHRGWERFPDVQHVRSIQVPKKSGCCC